MIDIIIPAYNAHNTLNRTLLSLLLQKNLNDLHIYIIDDCSDLDYKNEFEFFKDKMDLKIFRLDKNMGPGYARQFGIENSNSKYIVFIDGDDIFYNYYSVQYLYDTIENGNFDAVSANKLIGDNPNAFPTIFNDLHAKIYRREFLQNNNIHFSYMYNSEDIYFNNLFMMCKPNIGKCNQTVYVYNNTPSSLTNQNNYYEKLHIKNFIINVISSIIEAENLNYNPLEIAKVVIFSMAYLYYYFYNNMSDPNLKYVSELIPFYNKYHNLLDIETKTKIISFWIYKLDYPPIDMSYEDFIYICNSK